MAEINIDRLRELAEEAGMMLPERGIVSVKSKDGQRETVVIKDGERVDVIAEREDKTKRIKRRIRVDD